MQFNSVQDINAPLDFVFSQLTDFDGYEAHAMRVGAEVERQDSLIQTDAGMKWKIDGEFRGKHRTVNVELTEYLPDTALKFLADTKGFSAKANLNAMALTRKQSRIKVTVMIKPKTIASRLILQSAKLARNRLNRKFNHGFWTFAGHIESNYKQTTVA